MANTSENVTNALTAPTPGKYTPWAERFSDLRLDFGWINNADPKTIRVLETGLRDGDQSLETPMTLEQRIRYFEGLLRQGFVEIETGYPAASQTYWDFTRMLIEEKRIPDGVLQQVLTAGRADLIEKTFESLKDAPTTIVHVYVPTSVAQREVVFRQTRDQVLRNSVESTKLVRDLASKYGLNIIYQFSPESFTETEPRFALDVCNAVVDAWDPRGDEKVILNLPATVEVCDPLQYGGLIDYINRGLKRRDNVVISIHPHNDQGTATAAAQNALKAGAERIEGTLFGNGERAGNLDLLQVAANRFRQGIDPGIRLDNGPEITELYESCTGERVPKRHPIYSTAAYVAYSGTHQNAMDKYLTWLRETACKVWTGFPYLHGDPRDFGFGFDKLIIVNQNSGKNGVNNIMRETFKCKLPKEMLVEFAKTVQAWCDREGVKIPSDTMWNLFEDSFVNPAGPIALQRFTCLPMFTSSGEVKVHLELVVNGGRTVTVTGTGNGPIDAAVSALREIGQTVEVDDLEQHSRGKGSNADAIAYLQVRRGKTVTYGVGIDSNSETAVIKALIAGANRLSWSE